MESRRITKETRVRLSKPEGSPYSMLSSNPRELENEMLLQGYSVLSTMVNNLICENDAFKRQVLFLEDKLNMVYGEVIRLQKEMPKKRKK